MLKSIKYLETVGSYGVWNQPIVIDDQGEQQVAQLFFIDSEKKPVVKDGVPVEACLSFHCSDCTGRGMDWCTLEGPFSPHPTGWFIY